MEKYVYVEIYYLLIACKSETSVRNIFNKWIPCILKYITIKDIRFF